MRRYSLKILYAALLLFHASGFSLGFTTPIKPSPDAKCREKEREALLNFKQSLVDDYGILSTWTYNQNNTDCCNWKGIQCNHRTGHVILLHLSDTQLKGAINLTSLVPLQYIQHLDLSDSNFVLNYIPEAIGSFTNLKYLNLSSCEFDGRIPFQLGNLSLLRCLDLGNNILQGPIPFQIGNLRHLQYLDLRWNFLSGEIPFQLTNLKQLQYLNLGENSLSGAIPFELRNLKRLHFLNLAGNTLSGAIPFRNENLPNLQTLGLGGDFNIEAEDSEWLSNLHSLTTLELSSLHNLSTSPKWLQAINALIPNLVELRLVHCSLSDTNIKTLFLSHSNFSTSLTILDLSSNVLTSSTFQLLSNFSLNLQELYLTENHIALSSFLFSNFPSIDILDLSLNNLSASVFQGNFSFGSKLRKLRLCNCSLTDRSFPIAYASTINSSSSLVILDLSSNLLKSSTMFYWLLNCTNNLQTLYLSDNMLEGPIPDGFGKVMNSLKHFYVSDNRLQGKIPSFFGNMCRLQTLYLGNNKLNGEFSQFFQNSSWCNRHVFQNLDLSYNQITGKIPKSITLLSELENLYLDGNSLEGDVTESHLSNFSKLQSLSLSYNTLSVRFVSSWVPPFQATTLSLASCKLGPSFPGWLQTQNSLIWLDISDNELNDSVPVWFWNKLQTLSGLNMSHNNLNGKIPDIPLKLLYRPSIILNANQFEGALPSFLLQASGLFISKNKFSDLYSFLCYKIMVPYLATLDLSNNQIKGQIPDCWQSLNQLLFLDLSNNELSGNIPISMGNLFKLEALVLRNNKLTGELPSSLKNCTNLFMLDVGENKLSGPIPSWLGESMQQLIILNMQGNHLSEHFPIQLCYLRHIQLLNLSRNKLSKAIPACLKNFTVMSEKSINRSETQRLIYEYNTATYSEIYGFFVSLAYRLDITWVWKGVEQVFTDPQLNLKSIDLSSNNFTGEIPKEVVCLVGLVSLNLSRNNLSGEIPSEIGNLSSLESLDLSRNHLHGKIPSSLSQLDFLGKLDLSYNSLSGRIPLGRHLQTFEGSSFEGNIDLCGEEINKSCPGENRTAKAEAATEKDGDDYDFFEALYMSMGVGFFVGFWGLLGPILIWKPWRIAYLSFLNKFTN
ncbi:receptor-like protein EIX2 [Vigna unguiculata]|uniref:receptor-like protein EIX2 n=1 Tax=Vigna unguiculata TaxID=3917 RepID=UPI00101600A7|nr:receptor-like protein EIX2 [Vigna unguiculata]